MYFCLNSQATHPKISQVPENFVHLYAASDRHIVFEADLVPPQEGDN